jgi:hypothetical protein
MFKKILSIFICVIVFVSGILLVPSSASALGRIPCGSRCPIGQVFERDCDNEPGGRRPPCICSCGVAERGLGVSRFDTSVLTDVDADNILRDSSNVLSSRDGANDIACLSNLFRIGPVNTFTAGNGIINSQADFATIIALPGQVKVVNQINFCGVMLPNIIGCAPTPGESQVVVRSAASSPEGILWAHEYGHTRGLPHTTGGTDVMNPTILPDHLQINNQQCTAFQN